VAIIPENREKQDEMIILPYKEKFILETIVSSSSFR